MDRYSTIKVSKKNLSKLHRIAAKISLSKGERISLDDVISSLIEIAEKNSLATPEEAKVIENDRKKIIELLKIPMIGAGPEDYNEYNFEDILYDETNKDE
ncbi:MAG: hypothetical protein EU536_05065 [Promethearchaeota archaeon]|nr:MAG: hypothetical protein EU536_05065 [Candidatus Lokiarchaeota archaeon]